MIVSAPGASMILLAAGLAFVVVLSAELWRRRGGRESSLLWAPVWALATASVGLASLSVGRPWFGLVLALVLLGLAVGIGSAARRGREGGDGDALRPVLGPADLELYEQILSLHDTPVGRLMTPIDRVAFVAPGLPLPDVIALARTRRHDRIPILEQDLRPLGFIHAKDLALHVHGPGGATAESLRRDTLKVAPGDLASRVLDAFRIEKIHIAVVTDPGGCAMGIVTLDDFYQHLLGSGGERGGAAS